MLVNGKIILVFGLPRSGTTWLGKIFDSHPDVLYFHEPDSHLRIKIEDVPLFPEACDYYKYRSFFNDYINNLTSITNVEVIGKYPLFKKNFAGNCRQALFQYSVFLNKIIKRAFNVSVPSVSLKGRDRAIDFAIAWKSIESTGRLGVILKAFPECRGIFIVRHPCGQISSILEGEKNSKFSSSSLASEDYGIFEMLLNTENAKKYNLSIEKLKKMTSVQRLAWRWLLYNEHVLVSIKDINTCFVLKYEDLCESPDDSIEKLFDFFNINKTDQTNRFIYKSTNMDSDSYYSVHKNPKKSSEKWKEKLSSNDVDDIFDVLKRSEELNSIYLHF